MTHLCILGSSGLVDLFVYCGTVYVAVAVVCVVDFIYIVVLTCLFACLLACRIFCVVCCVLYIAQVLCLYA
jgi:hypothetical protein